MARTWQDLQRRRAGAAPAGDRPASPAPPSPAVDARAVSPRLAALMDERAALEQRMATIVSPVQAADPRAAILYQVPSMATRRADYRRWEDARERAAQDRVMAQGPSGALPVPAPVRPTPALRPTGGEVSIPRATPLDPALWAARRDGPSPARDADVTRPRRTAKPAKPALYRGELAVERPRQVRKMTLSPPPGSSRRRDDPTDRRKRTPPPGSEGGVRRAEMIAGAARTGSPSTSRREPDAVPRPKPVVSRPRPKAPPLPVEKRRPSPFEARDKRRLDRTAEPKAPAGDEGYRERQARLFDMSLSRLADLDGQAERLREQARARRAEQRRQDDRDEQRRARALDRRRNREAM